MFSLKALRPEQRDLLVMRAYYFALIGGNGFIGPFLNLFYVDLGLSGKQIGTFASISAIVGLIVAPLWVNEVKKRSNPRVFIQFALAIAALGHILISNQVAFLPIAIIVFFQAMASAGISPMSDSLAVRVTQAANTGYGAVRVMGSLGWIVTVPLSGWLIGQLGFKAGFFSTSLSYMVVAALLFFLRPGQLTGQTSSDQSTTGLRAAVKRVLQDRTLVGLALALICVGFLNNGIAQFENVYLAQLGATKSIISLAGIMSAIVELPFMLWADRIVRRFGPHRLLILALLMYMGLRLTVLAFPAILTILFMRFLTGICFSVYTVSFMGLVNQRTPSGETGMVLALFSVTLAGSVNIVASPLSGSVFDAQGAPLLYIFSASGYLLAALSLWFTRPRPLIEDANISGV